MYVIQEPDTYVIDKVGIHGKLYPTRSLLSSSEYILMTVQKQHETTIVERESNFVYFILSGSGYFIINGVSEPCRKGNLVVIPKGTPFTYKGKMRMLLICTPPWRQEQEQTLGP